jgi:predicted NBD/HSP70 family sugar kinase
MVVIPSRMGRLNKRALLYRLQMLGTASRAGLAKSLGLSQPTAGKIVDELIRSEIIQELDLSGPGNGGKNNSEAIGRVGRPGRMLRLNRERIRFLGIRLGVTDTGFSPLPVGIIGEDKWQLRLPTPTSSAAWLQQLRKAASQFRQKRFLGVLVSVPGIVDENKGRVLFSPNMHWTESAELTGLIQSVWDAPVILLQEERALALGHLAADPGSDGFLLVDFGEGVGGTVILDGKLYTNPLPLSGEIGHTPVRGNARPCGCGAVGCLETLVSTRGLLQSFAARSKNQSPSWSLFVKEISDNEFPPWLAETLDHTAIAIAGALNVLGVRRAIITGNLTDLPRVVSRYLAEAICRGAMWSRFGKIEVESAPRRRIAGLVSVGIDRLVVPMLGTDLTL